MLRESLRGIRVADFSQIGAGPTCSMFLADLGADVIKIEPPTGDAGRQLGPPWAGVGESAVYASFNRNKRSISLDLKSAAGFEVAQRLVSRADVVLESFRPGVMNRLGLGYGTVKERNPRVIYCSVSAYGSTGEGARLGGVDGIVQAASGLMSLLGDEGQPPSKVQAPVVDVATGHIATIAVLAQLIQRERVGTGGYLDVSMFAAAVALQQSSLTGYLADGIVPQRAGSAAPYSAPNEAFEASDGWIMVAAYQTERWERLCQSLEMPQLCNDPRFVSSSLRVENRKALRAALAPEFARQTCELWIEKLMANDILCSKVCDYQDVVNNPKLEHLQLIVDVTDERGQQYRFPGFPINSRESQSQPHRAPPRCGQHSAEILAELNYSAADAAALISGGSITAEQTPPKR
jgi:crotonobetainyl-CoA:carnitine CoA-transferase CaiB-like acyl-CoA transferase